MTTPILPLDRMKTLLDVAPGVDTYDPRISGLILAATRTFETACRRKFARAEQTDFRDARLNRTLAMNLYGDSDHAYDVDVRASRILLSCDPIDTSAPIEVYYDPRSRFAPDTLVPEDCYVVEAERGAILLDFATAAARRALKIVYTAGYPVDTDTGALAEDTCPADLALACELWVLRKFADQTAETAGADKAPRNKPGALDADIRDLLLPFHRLLTGAR